MDINNIKTAYEAYEAIKFNKENEEESMPIEQLNKLEAMIATDAEASIEYTKLIEYRFEKGEPAILAADEWYDYFELLCDCGVWDDEIENYIQKLTNKNLVTILILSDEYQYDDPTGLINGYWKIIKEITYRLCSNNYDVSDFKTIKDFFQDNLDKIDEDSYYQIKSIINEEPKHIKEHNNMIEEAAKEELKRKDNAEKEVSDYWSQFSEQEIREYYDYLKNVRKVNKQNEIVKELEKTMNKLYPQGE